MMKLLRPFIIVFLIMVLFSLVYAVDQDIDLSEKIMKIKNEIFFRFGERGFGFYDWGDGKLKIFNWNFEVESAIKITIGEGPGEIKPFIFNACLFEDKIFLNGYMETKINVYSKDGKFINTLSLDITPRKIIHQRDKLYVFNALFFTKTSSPLFAKIIDPVSGKTLKTINLKSKYGVSKEYEGAPGIAQRLLDFDVNNNELYLLSRSQDLLFEIDENGNLIKEIKLPYKFLMKYRTQKDGTNTVVTLSMYDLYTDFKALKNETYACFLKTIKYDEKTGESVFKTYLVKISKNGNLSQKVFNGDLRILGEHQGILYLFNFDDYHVITLKLNEWH